MSEEYQKFIFQDLPTNSVVHKTQNDVESEVQNSIIADAVVQHLGTVVNHPAEEHKEPEPDLTAIRAESYELGYNEAKMEFEPLIEQLKSDLHFSTLLHQKIEAISPKHEIDKEFLQFAVDIIKSVTEKLFLSVPVEFEKILFQEILSIAQKFYKEGKITVRVHSKRTDYCRNLLNEDNSMPREHIDVVVDDDLGDNDCVVEWNETKLEYNQERVKDEIEKIFNQLEQLKHTQQS